MMGTKESPGIIPRLCNAIFERIEEATCETLAFKVEVSYMEIYNERVRDLLDPKKYLSYFLFFEIFFSSKNSSIILIVSVIFLFNLILM